MAVINNNGKYYLTLRYHSSIIARLVGPAECAIIESNADVEIIEKYQVHVNPRGKVSFTALKTLDAKADTPA